MADDIAFMPATRLLALYRDRQLSPVEVIEHTLRRLESYESAINAFVLYDPETGLAMARASEARWQKGEPQGVLDGVPVALKDTLLTRGWPRLLGSRTIDPNEAWDEDAPVPGRLRAEGAVFFGKTTTRLERGDRFAAQRHHPQPVEPGANPRRQQRWQRRRGAGRHRSSRRRHRRRRLDPHPGRILRHCRP
jgi:Asp-tRNA(Asn)/Glu-tRNA(Gln) amidotransferase A subunit family amidase